MLRQKVFILEVFFLINNQLLSAADDKDLLQIADYYFTQIAL